MKQKTNTIKLNEQEFNDLVSAITFTLDKYPPEGAKNFLLGLKKINKKLWRKVKEDAKKDEHSNN